jgi:hypothetical protein
MAVKNPVFYADLLSEEISFLKASEKMLTQKPLLRNFFKTSFWDYLFWCIFS